MTHIERSLILVILIINPLIKGTLVTTSTGDTKAHVVGSLLTFCGSPVLYSPVSPYIPLDSADNNRRVAEPYWQTDWNIECLRNHTELINYCRSKFPNAQVTDVVLAPIRVPLRLPTRKLSSTTSIESTPSVLQFQPYWCLVGGSLSGNHTVHHLQPPAHHLPTLLDVHRAFFNERFYQLNTQIEEMVTNLVKQLIHNVEHLASLRDVSRKQSRHITSDLLQSAHQQLKAVWSANEVEWSKLEYERHADVSAQLESEDTAGEQEFAYVMQESGATIDRLQTALSRLLAGIAESVKEEVGHLKKVLQHQPVNLHLKVNTTTTTTKEHWSSRVTRYVTSLDQVHAVFLKLVKQATVAINILRTRMRDNSSVKSTSSPAPHDHHFQPTLIANYNYLQAELKEARHYLLLAKQRVLSELTRQSQSLVHQLGAIKADQLADKSSPFSADSSAGLSDPWGVLVKHQDDLAYIDFMVYHVLTNFPRNQSHWSGVSDDQLRAWNAVWRPNPVVMVKLTPEQMIRYRTSFVYSFLTAFKTVAIALCVGVAFLLLVSVVVYCTRRQFKRQGQSSHGQLVATWRHNAKHWLADTWIGSSREMGSSGTRQSRQGQPIPTVIDAKPSVPSVRGYLNPVC